MEMQIRGDYMQFDENKIQDFINMASLGFHTKNDVIEMQEHVQAIFDEVDSEIAETESLIQEIVLQAETAEGVAEKLDNIRDEYGPDAERINQLEELRGKRQQIWEYLDELDTIRNTYKNFNKTLCFSNIRTLLKASDVKIGQIEREAGVRLGYMSRLEKPDNTSEPSVEFVVTAAKRLGISLDVLLSIEMAELTSTEMYLVSFLQKLQKDTIEEKLEWGKESAESLNRLEPDINGNINHPLFSFESYMEKVEDFPEHVERVTFVSHSYECHTYIKDACYNLRMKNGSVLYLMDISKSVYRVGDPDALAKEIWMYTPGVGCQFIISNKDVPQLANLVDVLFETVRGCMKHPKIKKEVKCVIDAFLSDDLGENDSDLPFN